MKKLMYLAAALLVLVACDNQGNNAPERTPFKKGQQVTLTVGSANQGSQAPARTMSGARNDDNIAFTWEEGDKILVKVGDKTAEFTLSSEPGLNEGEFAGTMPAAGSTFDIQYPTTTPDLSAQVYTTDKAIPANSMLFTATDCTLDAPATLTAKNAMVQLNLFGTDKTVGKIVFTNKTANPAVSYTLTCTGGKTIAATSTEATPFYMVVLAGTYQFEVEVWDNATTSAKICSFATSAAKTFTAGKCLNMPAKEVKAATPTVDPKDVFNNGAKINFNLDFKFDNVTPTLHYEFNYTNNGSGFTCDKIIESGVNVTSDYESICPVVLTGNYTFTFNLGPDFVLEYDGANSTYKCSGNNAPKTQVTDFKVNEVSIFDQLTKITD